MWIFIHMFTWNWKSQEGVRTAKLQNIKISSFSSLKKKKEKSATYMTSCTLELQSDVRTLQQFGQILNPDQTQPLLCAMASLTHTYATNNSDQTRNHLMSSFLWADRSARHLWETFLHWVQHSDAIRVPAISQLQHHILSKRFLLSAVLIWLPSGASRATSKIHFSSNTYLNEWNSHYIVN